MNLIFLIHIELFSFIPYIQSINKSYWLDLQNIPRISFYHVPGYHLRLSIYGLFLDYCSDCFAGFFASALSPYSLFSVQQLVCCLMLSQIVSLHKTHTQSKSQILTVAYKDSRGLTLHYPVTSHFPILPHGYSSPHWPLFCSFSRLSILCPRTFAHRPPTPTQHTFHLNIHKSCSLISFKYLSQCHLLNGAIPDYLI